MSTRELPDPAAMGRQITRKMPRSSHVTVIPRDRDHHQCPARAADYYEVHIYPVAIWPPSVFDDIKTAIRAWPGCFQVTQEKDMLQRPMVLALITNPPKDSAPKLLRGNAPHGRWDTPHQRLSPHQCRHRPGRISGLEPAPGEQIVDSWQAGLSRSGDCGTRPPLWYI